MILTDTGPLIALIESNEPNHVRCTEIANKLPPGPLVTTWPCFTEAMYLLGKSSGHKGQRILWNLRREGRVALYESSEREANRMEVLMEQYHDSPMDLADASLVATAESLNLSKIFTLDKHFHAYRIHDTKPFKVVP